MSGNVLPAGDRASGRQIREERWARGPRKCPRQRSTVVSHRRRHDLARGMRLRSRLVLRRRAPHGSLAAWCRSRKVGRAVTGFGTFGAKSWPARIGREPRTGEAVAIRPSTSPTFKTGKTLKDMMNARPTSRPFDERRPRREAPQTAFMSKPVDFYRMTDTRPSARLPSGRPRASAGLAVTLRLRRVALCV